ncbi:MAG: hypothetical protein QNJ12_00310 [Ilumatobacter sp.]|uniref:helix-turn-helix domain-containing protein n=1 Tax=Ilumatobacter sp. TaxID=1967498 RepID=UPI002630DC15|nr:hypothetical protein [Ilumatobacter sp.]MDJ0767193.1 hypothetical protein [Ilumatobacter sp.]
MDSVTVARSMRGSIGMLAMDWLMAESTRTTAEERGLPAGLAAYAVGRLGVLGDCPVDNVVGAACFWEPDFMRGLVIEGRSAATPHDGAAIYAAICQEWGEQKLFAFGGTERLGELCERVVAHASPLGAPLFVGWRDQHIPVEEGPARTFQLCQVMRELRFSRHTIAVLASGMSPLDAILSGPAGEWNAEFFGWPKPYPDEEYVASLAEQRTEIEAHTDRLHAADFEVLTDDERAELRDLAKAARAHATERT